MDRDALRYVRESSTTKFDFHLMEVFKIKTIVSLLLGAKSGRVKRARMSYSSPASLIRKVDVHVMIVEEVLHQLHLALL